MRMWLCLCIICLITPALRAQDLLKTPIDVAYIHDSVLMKNGNVITLMLGSKWAVAAYTLVLPASDIVIILTDEQGNGLAYADGAEFSVSYISGPATVEAGKLSVVTRQLGDGAILELSDGSLWEVPRYDQFDTGFWLPPYVVIITQNELSMINVEKGKKIWVSRAR